jgi:hypothetical protein
LLTILWLALHPRLILAVSPLLAGLSITASSVGIGVAQSYLVAFTVLFIGLGVDFGIQFSVRYRAERHEVDDLRRRSSYRKTRWRAADLGRGAAQQASFVSTDRLQRTLRAGSTRRARNDRCFSHQHYSRSCLGVCCELREPAEMGFKALAGRRFMGGAGSVIIGTVLAVTANCLCCTGFNSARRSTSEAQRPDRWRRSSELRSDPPIGASSIFVLAPNKKAARSKSKIDGLTRGREREGRGFIPDDQQAQARGHSSAGDRARSGSAARS